MVKAKEFKLVLLGMSGVGKTSLICRYMDNQFNENVKNTVEMAFRTKLVRVESKTIKLNIWDTAGQERYVGLVSMYYKNSQAAIVVYDIENEASFYRAQHWVISLQKLNPPPIVIALAANKTDDLKQSVVDIEMVKKYAEDNNLTFMETSCKTALNVQEIFQTIAEKLSREHEYAQPDDNDKIQLNNHKKDKSKRKCC